MNSFKPQHSKKPKKYYSKKQNTNLYIKIVLFTLILVFVVPQLTKVFKNTFTSNTTTNTNDKECIEKYKDEYYQNLCKLKISGNDIYELLNSDLPKYTRKNFTEGWLDTNNNGCDTRNDILHRDLENISNRGCKVFSGKLKDPYTGKNINFDKRLDSEAVQIDHIVALQNAWLNGAWEWDIRKREEFANDPLNLLAVDGQSNQDKGSKDFAHWIPTNKKAVCPYAKRQITIKSKYDLQVTSEEKTALFNALDNCK